MMQTFEVRGLLTKVSNGEVTIDEAIATLRLQPFEQFDFATLDTHRSMRRGFPEVVFCEGKTARQVSLIFERLSQTSRRLLGTRATEAQYIASKQLVPDLQFAPSASCIWINREPETVRHDGVVIVAAGTSDLPVVEEAAITLELQGHKPHVIMDVGVAGLHRLFPHIQTFQTANVVIVIAGMEGALPSVIGGLTDAPVIGVPTSIGYGANLNGLTAMLAMLTSCSAGLSVVNVNNGYGAARMASAINTRIIAAAGLEPS